MKKSERIKALEDEVRMLKGRIEALEQAIREIRKLSRKVIDEPASDASWSDSCSTMQCDSLEIVSLIDALLPASPTDTKGTQP